MFREFTPAQGRWALVILAVLFLIAGHLDLDLPT